MLPETKEGEGWRREEKMPDDKQKVPKSKTKQECFERKVKKVMHEYGQGTLHSANGDKVTSQDQAVAIAYNEGYHACRKHDKRQQKLGRK